MPEILICHEFDTAMNETTPFASTAPSLELNPCLCGALAEFVPQDCSQYSGYIVRCTFGCSKGSFQKIPFKYLQTAVDHWNSFTNETTPSAPETIDQPATNENTVPSLELNPCPNCGWSETDEQVFQESVLEYQQNFSDPSLWRKILRRISDGPVLLSDLWYYACIQLLFTAFEDSGFSVDLFNRIVISFFVVGTVVISRFVYRIISDWKFRLMFEDDLSLP